MKQKFIALILTFVCCFSMLSVPVSATSTGTSGLEQNNNQKGDTGYKINFQVDADAVYLLNLNTNKLVYEKNATKKIYPASTTKIMTAVLALENIKNIDTEIVKVEPYMLEYFKNLDYFYSNVELKVGEEILAKDLLYALMVPSGSDAANVIAGYVAGSIDGFVDMMNEKAAELGMDDTHFTNPHGLHDDEHYTTAYDLSLLGKYAVTLNYFMDIVKTSRYTYSTNMKDKFTVTTTNNMQNQKAYPDLYYPPIAGIKTGTTDEAGHCLVSTATKGDQSYLLVLMGAPLTDSEGKPYPVKKSFTETKKMYEWAFENFTIKYLIKKDEIVHDVGIRMGGRKKRIHLKTEKDLYQILPKQYDENAIIEKYDVPEFVDAPIKEGDVIGRLDLVLADDVVGSVNLYASEDVERNSFSYAMQVVKDSTKTKWFKVAVAIVILLVIIIIYMVINRKKQKKRARRRRYKRY